MPRKPLEPEIELERATRFVYKYHPHGASRDLFHDKSDELLIVGPKGTGKSLSVLQKHHLMLCKYPGARGFMCRKTRTSMTNSCLLMFQKMVLKPADKVHFHKQDQVFRYPNGSEYAVVGLDDVNRLNSSEWDFGYMQEATEATENDWEICTACIRHGLVPYQQLIGDANPDRPSHWLKARVDRGLTKMLMSKHEDNPKFFNQQAQDWTPEGQRYMEKLRRLSGVRYRRLYLGEWAAAEGVVYEMWDQHIHMVSRHQLPMDWVDWPHYWAVDFGYKHPFVWGDWMEAPNGVLYLNRQIFHTKRIVEDHCHQIMDITDGMPPPRAIICDHDAEDRATFERHTGMTTLPAYKAIQPGIQAVQSRLLSDERWEGGRGLYVLRDSLIEEDPELKDAGKPYNTQEEFEGYSWPDRINKAVNSKKDEVPKDEDNHGMDMTRYMVAFVDSLSIDPSEEEHIIFNDDDMIISPY